MQFSFNVAPPDSQGEKPSHPEEPTDQLALMRTMVAMQDGAARWRAMLAKWGEEFPGIATVCKAGAASLEQTYLRMVADLNEKLAEESVDGGLDNEFVLNEFLDRYGTRLTQIGNLLNLLNPLADAAPKTE